MDDPTFTDEELAQADWLVWRIHEYGASPDDCDKLQRLIAALRASREEVERLREQNDGLYQATLMLGAEVEGLRALAPALRCILRSPSHLSDADERRAVDALLAYEQEP